jgi:hypothetical protein
MAVFIGQAQGGRWGRWRGSGGRGRQVGKRGGLVLERRSDITGSACVEVSLEEQTQEFAAAPLGFFFDLVFGQGLGVVGGQPGFELAVAEMGGREIDRGPGRATMIAAGWESRHTLAPGVKRLAKRKKDSRSHFIDPAQL